MKKLCTLFLVFVAIAAYAQNNEEDYVKFDENGNLTEFRQTAKDGTEFRFWFYDRACSELKIFFPDGSLAYGYTNNNAKDLYNSIKNGTIDVVKEINDNMRGYEWVSEEKRELYYTIDVHFIPNFELSDKDGSAPSIYKTNLSNLVLKILQEPTQNSYITYYTSKGGKKINAVRVDTGSCGLLNDTYVDGSYLYVYPEPGFQYGQNLEENCKGVLGGYKKVSDGYIALLCVEDKITVVARANDEGWNYKGTIKGDVHKIGNRRTPDGWYYDVYYMDKGLIDTITSVKHLPFNDGKLYHQDGKISEYKTGVLYSITDKTGLITIYDEEGNPDPF